jgi:predicted nucleic acid-binding protein
MNVLIDTNVVLNILLEQPDFYTGSKKIFTLAEMSYITGFVSASAITDIFYVSQKWIGKAASRKSMKHILHVFHPATVTDNNIYDALDLEWDDFEDSVQYVVGTSLHVDYIVTRNIKDYSSGYIPAVTPEHFMQIITEKE